MAKSSAILALTLAGVSFFGGNARAQEEFLGNASDIVASFGARAQKLKSQAESSIRQLASAAPDVSAYSVRGVDVSHHEDAIDWAMVRGSGVSFAYIKATEGDDFVDPDFAKNWRDAAKAGVLRGAYHFYNFCRKGSDQADRFIKTVPTAERGTLPPVLDLEESKDCPVMPKRDDFRKALAVYAAKVTKAYRQAPVMYVNYSIYNAYFRDAGDGYKIWITDGVHRSPRLSDDKPWAFWQYGYRASVPGISVPVDVDVFNGSASQLAALTRKAAGRSKRAAALIASQP